jgi:4-hydroxy-2-oxoglutarate aldolase
MTDTPTLEGILPPLPTFFDRDDALDLSTLNRHVSSMHAAGIRGFVALGSNGEAPHLDDGERFRVIATVREAAGDDGLVVTGASAASTRGTIALCRQAASAGAHVALVLTPAYYRGQMTAAVLRAYYVAVADASPIPVAIYNMPANAAGVDLDAETVIALAAHPRIIAVKDSSGNIAKLAQIVAGAREGFAVFAGSAGFLLPALSVGAVGAVAALANIAPRECLRIVDLWRAGQLDAARELQARLVAPNTAVTTGYGVAGLKAALRLVAGYGGEPRAPLTPLSDADRVRLRLILTEADLLQRVEV